MGERFGYQLAYFLYETGIWRFVSTGLRRYLSLHIGIALAAAIKGYLA